MARYKSGEQQDADRSDAGQRIAAERRRGPREAAAEAALKRAREGVAAKKK